jgi:hypothetical protein
MGLLSCTTYVDLALLRSIHALRNESELATNVTVGEQGGWLDGVARLVLWFAALCFRSSLLSFWLLVNSHFWTTVHQLSLSTTIQQLDGPGTETRPICRGSRRYYL